MAVRDGMANVIAELRALTDLLFLEPADAYESDPEATYWTDQVLQDNLDRYARHDIFHLPLTVTPELSSGNYVYTKYFLPTVVGMWEEDDDGYFVIKNSSGNTVSSSTYSVDFQVGLVEFVSSTGGTVYYVDGRSYNQREAAAKVWFKKAAFRAELITWKAGDHTLHEDQIYKHCMDMYKHFAGTSGKVRRFKRVDYAIS